MNSDQTIVAIMVDDLEVFGEAQCLCHFIVGCG